jgi:hypothetical protein
MLTLRKSDVDCDFLTPSAVVIRWRLWARLPRNFFRGVATKFRLRSFAASLRATIGRKIVCARLLGR